MPDSWDATVRTTCGGKDGLDDVLIAGAAAEIARHAKADVRGAGRRVVLQQTPGTGDHARGAKAALQAVMLAKALLQHRHAVRPGNALDRGDRGAIGLRGKDRAGFHRLAVQIDRAGAAMAGFSADMRPGQSRSLAQDVDRQLARFRQRFHGCDTKNDRQHPGKHDSRD